MRFSIKPHSHVSSLGQIHLDGLSMSHVQFKLPKKLRSNMLTMNLHPIQNYE